MSDEKTKGPDFDVVTFADRPGRDKGFALTIGAAWKTKEGTGFNVTLDALPVNGRITLMPRKAKADLNAEAEIPQ